MHEQKSFPVGKVDELKLYPMNFIEFVMAIKENKMSEGLINCNWQTINALSGEYIDLLRQYYYVGGMPAAVLSYSENKNTFKVREIQRQILSDYEQYFSKHAPYNEVPHIRMVWNNIPSQLVKENKKFIYGALKKGARASSFEIAIQCL